MLEVLDYKVVRPRMRPGDVILFAGNGPISTIVKWATWSPISHAGLVSKTHNGYRARVYVSESTRLDGRTGVFTRRMSEVIAKYRGRVYWMPLTPDLSKSLDTRTMMEYITEMQDAKYDLWRCFRAGFKSVLGFNLTRVDQASNRVFCSQHVALALLAGGAFPANINPSLTTPKDLMSERVGISNGKYFQLKGKPKPLRMLDVIAGGTWAP